MAVTKIHISYTSYITIELSNSYELYNYFASSALILPQILFFWFVIPESPRWLVTQKRWKPLRKMMSTCERMNGKRIPSCLIIPSENEKLVNNRRFDHQLEYN